MFQKIIFISNNKVMITRINQKENQIVLQCIFQEEKKSK